MPAASVSGRSRARMQGAHLLDDLPPPTLDRLLSGGTPRFVTRGETFFRSSDIPPRGGVVLEGLVRVYLESPDGRRLTLRNARPRSMVGVVTALMGDAVPINVQALTDGQVLELPLELIRSMAAEDATFAWALACEVSRRLVETIDAFAIAKFGTVRAQLARHILDLADELDPSNRLFARVTHQQLADGIGTVREVVARHLADLRDEGYLLTDRGLITIVNLDGLDSVGQLMARWH